MTRFLLVSWLLVVTGAFAAPPPVPVTCDALRQFFAEDLTKYQERVDEASRNYQLADWEVETADPKASTEKVSQLFGAYQKVSYDTGVLRKTQSLDDSSASLDPKECAWKGKLKRVRQILEASIVTNDAVVKKEKENADLQEKMMNQSNGFRVTLPGEKEPVSKAIYQKKLGSTADRKARRSLYLAFNGARAKQWLQWGFRDLIKSRNEEGKLAGFKNYVDYRYFRSQLDLKNYLSLVDQVKRELAPKLRAEYAKLASRAHIKKLQPWDFAYLTEQESSGELDKVLAGLPADATLNFARAFYGGLGIDIDALHFTMDLYPRAGKNTHAFTSAILLPRVDEKGEVLAEPKPDIRFLANLRQPVKWDDVSTVIHELGHAVHAAYVRQPVGVFRDIGSVGTEAIAMTAERMAASPEFLGDTLTRFTGATAAAIQPTLDKQVRAARFHQAYMIVRQVFFSDFEYQMYLHPDADYTKIWSKLYDEYYGWQIPVTASDWDVEHYLMAPVYIQNYSIGLLMVEQVYASMVKDFHTSYHSAALGDKLKKIYFGPGTEPTYLDLVLHFTGKPLSADDALKLLD